MKKTLKTIIASILVISMLFGTVSASAVSLLTPDSEINASVPNSTFTADESGYYCSEGTIRQNGTALNYVAVNINDQKKYLYYLEKDENYSLSNDSYSFVGSKIDRITATDITVFDNFILGIDFNEGATSISLDYPIGLVFGSLIIYTYNTTLICEDGIVEGENKVKFDIPNYEKTRILYAYNYTDVIETVDVSKKHTSAFVDYEGAIFAEDISEAVITINGNQEIVNNEYACFVYSSRKYPVSAEREFDEEGNPVKTKVYISGNLGKLEIASFDAVTVEADAFQNIERAEMYYTEKIYDLYFEMVDKYIENPDLLPIIYVEMIYKESLILFDLYKTLMRILIDELN